MQDGKEVETMTLATTGDATTIKLTPDRATIKADGQDLSFVDVEVVDKDGNLQPNADQLVTFSLDGPGTIAGLGNAYLKSEEPYQGTQCHVYKGRAQIVIRSQEKAGECTLKASADGLNATTAKIETQ